jgi:hypothetical protein
MGAERGTVTVTVFPTGNVIWLNFWKEDERPSSSLTVRRQRRRGSGCRRRFRKPHRP